MFDLGQLCVLKGSQCWVLYIDILILECGGNLFDAVSMGVKAAMHSTRIPNVKVCSTRFGFKESRIYCFPSGTPR